MGVAKMIPSVPLDYIENGMTNILHTTTLSMEIQPLNRLTIATELQYLYMNFHYTEETQQAIFNSLDPALLNLPINSTSTVKEIYTVDTEPLNLSYYASFLYQLTDNFGLSTGVGRRSLTFTNAISKKNETEYDYMASLSYYITDNLLIKSEYHYIDGNLSSYNPFDDTSHSADSGHLGLVRVSFSF